MADTNEQSTETVDSKQETLKTETKIEEGKDSPKDEQATSKETDHLQSALDVASKSLDALNQKNAATKKEEEEKKKDESDELKEKEKTESAPQGDSPKTPTAPQEKKEETSKDQPVVDGQKARLVLLSVFDNIIDAINNIDGANKNTMKTQARVLTSAEVAKRSTLATDPASLLAAFGLQVQESDTNEKEEEQKKGDVSLTEKELHSLERDKPDTKMINELGELIDLGYVKPLAEMMGQLSKEENVVALDLVSVNGQMPNILKEHVRCVNGEDGTSIFLKGSDGEDNILLKTVIAEKDVMNDLHNLETLKQEGKKEEIDHQLNILTKKGSLGSITKHKEEVAVNIKRIILMASHIGTKILAENPQMKTQATQRMN